MPEPLKNLYDKKLITAVGKKIKQVYAGFDSASFNKAVFCHSWQAMELKQRMRHIAECLHQFLPSSYKKSLQILKSASSSFTGFEYMFFPDFVELYGIDEFGESVKALEHFTKFSSSEFAVRPFIKKHESKMMKQMQLWAAADNHHVRRLASEGCRPRLPWAMALPEFKKNPKQIIKILKKLKDDESEYVRRSVANNLNDIAKDNPELVIGIAKTWFGGSENRNRLLKHGCRTLLKQAEPEVMKLFGFSASSHLRVDALCLQPSVAMGQRLEFSFTLTSTSGNLGKLRIEYRVDFMKANGKQAGKLFKVSEADYAIAKKDVRRNHSFKQISTRKYYAGKHGLAILVNGKELASGSFKLRF